MRHLIVCRDYPPASAGGIGVYSWHISRLLAEAGKTVHVVAQKWKHAEQPVERLLDGRLTIHRIPFINWREEGDWKPHPRLSSDIRQLHQNCPSPATLFGWQAAPLIERLVEEENIDLVEGSEYEAPLYFYMLRRAMKLGPALTPPCLIHLHSPTELLAQCNDEDTMAPFRRYAIRHEEYCIHAADAFICPSHAMKDWACSRYNIEPERIQVIQLPVGNTPFIERSEETWKSGTVAFVGRLQPCKGVIEFVRAAVQIASADADARFEFYGGDTAYLAVRNRSMRSVLADMIPAAVRHQFQFHGNLPREMVFSRLSKARFGVVPSRWENFPNACIEMMATGLPVLATAVGGIPEIVRDGVDGWLAPACDFSSLTAALQRAMATDGATLATMGASAVGRISEICDNALVTRRQIEARRMIVQRKAAHSLMLPPNLPRARETVRENKPVQATREEQEGIAIAIPCYNQGSYLRECLESIKRQTVKPVSVVVVDDGSNDPLTISHLDEAKKEGWTILHKSNGGLVSARNAGIQAIIDSHASPLGIVCIDSDDLLRPQFVERAAHVLRHCPEVGIVSCWVKHFESADRVWMQPCPSFPYQWTTNEVATFCAVRTEALVEVGLYQLEMHQGCYADWDLFNAVLACGWVGVTIPEVLGDYRVRDDSILRGLNAHAHGRMRSAMFARFADQVARDAIDIALLSEASDSWILREEVFTLRAQVARARSFIRRPDRAVRWLSKKIASRIERAMAKDH